MRFFEENWPTILTLWIGCVVSAFAVKILFFSHMTYGYISVEEMIQGIPQNDTRLLDYVFKLYLFPPSVLAYNLTTKKERHSQNLIRRITNYHIKNILGKMPGFFVECRAYDGEIMSKTLDLERKYKWKGLLIEPDPILFPTLLSKRRKAWISNTCLSPDPVAQNLDFLRRVKKSLNQTEIDSSNIIVHPNDTSQFWKKMKVPCFPLFSLLSALEVSVIDFLSLDSQGLELQILFNIPWDLVTIKMISINVQSTPEGPDGVKSFLKSKNYILVTQLNNQDYIFAHKSLNSSVIQH